ncbi:hypothetical protein vseg_016839 [Gypsophila vaccaria]
MAVNTSTKTIAILFVTLTSLAISASAQGSGTEGTCVAQLTGCISYLNATTMPPSTCCGPLKDAVTNQKACLCSLYNNPALLTGINVTQAMNLPVLCKIPTTTSPTDFCKGVTPPSGSPSSSSNSSSTPSGGNSTTTGSKSGSNSVATTSGTVFVSSLLMLVTYVAVY